MMGTHGQYLDEQTNSNNKQATMHFNILPSKSIDLARFVRLRQTGANHSGSYCLSIYALCTIDQSNHPTRRETEFVCRKDRGEESRPFDVDELELSPG